MPPPVKYTCPDIDKVIEHMKEIFKGLNSYMGEQYDKDFNTDTLDSLRQIISVASGEIDDYTRFDVNNPLEKLRESNSKLRQWGEEQEELLKEKETEVYELQKEVLSMENKIEDLEKELKELQNQ